jgi:Fe-S cluster assembly protein SufD
MTISMSTVSDAPNLSGKTKVDRTAYLAHLLTLRADLDADSVWMQSLRDRATARVQELAIPSTRDEDWRFTDLSALLATPLQAVGAPAALSFELLEPYLFPEATSRLVFVDGIYAPDLSTIDDLPDGVCVANLAIAAEFIPTLSNYFAQQQGSDEVFTALNTASLTDGALVWIPPNQIVENPIHLLFVATGTAPLLTHPRSLIVAAAGSQATLIEDYVSLHDAPYCTNAVTEVWLGDNAQVHHNRVQRDSQTAFHIGKTAVSQGRDSRYTSNAVNLGGQVSRHNLEIFQTGEQTDTVLRGLTFVTGDRLADTHSLMAFTQPHGTCEQVHKCLVGDRAHGVFNGKIFVPKRAQLTNASQLSRNLLLSPKARVDTKPQLEITADNVKCAHGATVSQLEDDEVFYLQSRGIDQDAARHLLVYAFAQEVIQQIPAASLRQALADSVAIAL